MSGVKRNREQTLQETRKKAKRDADDKKWFDKNLRKRMSSVGPEKRRQWLKEMRLDTKKYELPSEHQVPYFRSPRTTSWGLYGLQEPLLSAMNATDDELEGIENSYSYLAELRETMLSEIGELREKMEAVIDKTFDAWEKLAGKLPDAPCRPANTEEWLESLRPARPTDFE